MLFTGMCSDLGIIYSCTRVPGTARYCTSTAYTQLYGCTHLITVGQGGQIGCPSLDVRRLDLQDGCLLHPRFPRGAELIQHGCGEMQTLSVESQGGPHGKPLEVLLQEGHPVLRRYLELAHGLAPNPAGRLTLVPRSGDPSHAPAHVAGRSREGGRRNPGLVPTPGANAAPVGLQTF